MNDRCGRPTRAGAACSNFPVRWYPEAGEDPRACHDHMPDAAQQAYLAARQARAEAQEAREPACWTWELPTEDFRAKLREEWATHPQMLSGESFDALVLEEWHRDRCAICGREGMHLVGDHSHYTGLERGYLCRGCNISEGMNGGGVWRRYRQRNPASILGVRVRYVGPFCEDPDFEATQTRDRWGGPTGVEPVPRDGSVT